MSDKAAHRSRMRPASPVAFKTALVVLAMLLAAILGLAGLDKQKFWDDEANTAIFARNLLRLGRLTAWDGTNLVGYAYGGSLGEDLGQELRVPPLPAYVASAGMLLFGETTFGARVLFVAAGVLAVGLLAVWARRLLGKRFPWYLPSLILAISPAYLLFVRNCRYYALGVLFSLLVWIIWTRPASAGQSLRGGLWSRTEAWRYAGGAMATLLLILSQYLNAAAVLVTLPLCFVDPGYRNRRQYVLLAVLWATAALYGLWALAAANPFATDYAASAETLPATTADFAEYCRHTYQNFLWNLRDVGTHEFFPWGVVPLLALPWLLPRLVRLRPIARRGAMLVMILVAYLLVGALMTPADMGKGPTAEIRYVVPVTVLGSVVGALAVAILWRLARPLALLALVLVAGTNLLHLGPLARRYDQTSAWWPPTLCRYLGEIVGDYETGNEAMVDWLGELPTGTMVRVWPPHLVYAPMFYVPQLHYCDQLTEAKRIREDLREELPDYLFAQRAKPEIVIVALPYLREKLNELEFYFGANSYRIQQTIAPYWDYTWKPEIPRHYFSAPDDDWAVNPGLVVLVRRGSPIESHPAVISDPTDPDALCRLGIAMRYLGDADGALKYLEQALQLDPRHSRAHFQLATFFLQEKEGDATGEPRDAPRGVAHYRAAVEADPAYFLAHVNLGTALQRLGHFDAARRHYLEAARLKPNQAVVYFNLGNLAQSQPGKADEAIEHYRNALRYDPEHAKSHVNWGIVLAKQGKTDEAIEHYQAALRIYPGMVEAHVNLAFALSARGEKASAIEELEIALALVPPEWRQIQQLREKLRELRAQ